MSRALQATTDNVRIYSYNSAFGGSSAPQGKVFVLVNISDGEHWHRATGQSGWTVLRDKREVLHQLNNAILDSINNYLSKAHESPKTFYRYHESGGNNAKLLKDMTEEYGLSVKLRAYKIMYQTDVANQIMLTRKRKFLKIKRNDKVIARSEYAPIRKRDINESFSAQTDVELEPVKSLENRRLSQNIKEIYREKRDSS